MAVRQKRSRTECLSQCEGLLVMGFGQRARRQMAICCDLTDEVSRIGLMASFLLLPGVY
jgi:hypothetical protein